MECKSRNWYNNWCGRVGFNRYIMECKSIYIILLQKKNPELIDTLWNVN